MAHEFIRFVTQGRDHDSGVDSGIFQAAHRFLNSPIVPAPDRQVLSELLKWFGENLATPDRFNRTRSKGYYRRSTAGIAWLRDSAAEHLRRMHRLKDVLEAQGCSVTIIRESRVGYIVYEDEYQVIAEPFADTRTQA